MFANHMTWKHHLKCGLILAYWDKKYMSFDIRVSRVLLLLALVYEKCDIISAERSRRKFLQKCPFWDKLVKLTGQLQFFWGSNTSFKWNFKLLDKIFHCSCFSKLKDEYFRATASNGSSKFLTVLIRCPLWLIELLGDCWPTPHPKLSTRKIRQICRKAYKADTST